LPPGLLAKQIDMQDSLIGLYFIEEELIKKCPKSHKTTATKKSRAQKWKEMCQFGLEAEYAN